MGVVQHVVEFGGGTFGLDQLVATHPHGAADAIAPLGLHQLRLALLHQVDDVLGRNGLSKDVVLLSGILGAVGQIQL